MATAEVSHGRGGAGNINPDDTQYVDGEVVRAGEEGSHQDGAYSTGRGGKEFSPCSLLIFPFPLVHMHSSSHCHKAWRLVKERDVCGVLSVSHSSSLSYPATYLQWL